MTEFKVINKKSSKMAIWAYNPYSWGYKLFLGSKKVKMNLSEKSENVMFLHSLRLSFMPKIRKIYRAVLRENLVRQTERQRERQRDRDGPEYKGPPDAIAKLSDQKWKHIQSNDDDDDDDDNRTAK